MAGKIKNWTSHVEAEESMALIRQALSAHRARKVRFEQEKGGSRKVALCFELLVGTHLLRFRLRAELAMVEMLVYESYQGHYRRGSSALGEQAYRTAWANLKGYVQVALTLVESGCAVLEQVFFPYLLIPDGKEDLEAEETSFERFRKQLALPMPQQEEPGTIRGQYTVVEER